ncbi:hypothetical protein CY652_08150 [Burkholderia sp. WAC0059]|uniref:hypothetical protein n=1 Tax=Burkholderia sp. WAC0059 TaxID=2066022 RepID=UPI000C7F3D71|nr:hypothetical protein [Burkholderia sp. WAC0059]PLZ02883.1 hypothetical protein CY652_08150 [Burkholderia sp. WAC0059]
MRFRSSMAAGALALVPVLALAGQADIQAAAQPMFVSINGQTVPVQAETRVVKTAAGPMKVSTWSWHSPRGGASFEMQTSTGGLPPADALRQIRAMEYQMRAAQGQMLAMQQQMQRQMLALQHAALVGSFALPAPQDVVFSAPLWAMPDPVVVVYPVEGAAPASAPPARSPGLRV